MSKAKILIVEDEGITALNIKSLLENWGYENTSIVSSSDEALQNMSKSKSDLVLMDINLNGDVDGVEIAKELQNDFDIPVVYLTAHSDEKTLGRAKVTEPYGYIIKPFNNDELRTAIDIALYRHKMEKKLKKANKLLQIELEKRKCAEEELKIAKNNLELKVQERTREIKESNNQLKQEIEDRKKVENALKKSEEKYRYLVENINDVIFALDINGNFTYISPTIEKIAGYNADEVIGQHFTLFVHPDDQQGLLASMERTLTGQLEPYEFRILDKNGSTMYIRTFSRPMLENRQVISLNGVMTDITERKKSEDKINRLADIVGSSDDAIVGLTLNKIITSWNKGAEEVYGYLSEEMIDNSPSILFNPSQWENVSRELDKIKKGEKLIHYEAKRLRKDGKKIYVSVKLSPIQNSEGEITGISIISRDITERKKNEEKIKEYLNRLDTLNKIILTANRSNDLKLLLRDVLNLVLELMDFDGGGIYLIHEDKRVAEIGYTIGTPKDIIEKVENISIDEYPYRALYVDGKSQFISDNDEIYPEILNKLGIKSMARAPIYSRDKIIGSLNFSSKKRHYFTQKEKRIIVSIGREIGNTISKLIAEEEMSKLIEELKRSNDELQQFAHITSHDLQEPLRIIASFTQLLERRYKNKLDKDADEFMGYIVEASIRMKQMINDLLEYSRLARIERKIKLLKSEEVLANVIGSLNLVIKKNKAKITYDSLPTITADENQLGMVFKNLIENSIKFRKGNEPIKIHISAKEDIKNKEYVFNVSDNGIGIEEQYFNRIFTIFQRLHTREKYQGTGIGLSISKRIIERHGGRMWVESEPEVGSTFYFTIPINLLEKSPQNHRFWDAENS